MMKTTITGLVDITPYYGLISISGQGAERFLQGQLTCDMREITETHLHLGAYCNLKGRIRALFRIFKKGNVYFLQLPIALTPSTLVILKKYVMFSKVVCQDVSAEWQRIGIMGPLPDQIEAVLQTNNTLALLTFPNQHFRAEWIGLPNYVPLDDNQISSFEAWKYLDIEAGIPEIWAETVEQLLPHDIHLPQLGAVSFTKGCYCGQEIIARMEYKAKIKRQLCRAKLKTNTIPAPGTPIFNSSTSGEPVGSVITSCQIKENEVELSIEILIDAKNSGLYVKSLERSLVIFD